MATEERRRHVFDEWVRFLQAESHVLRTRPDLLFQQAANQPDLSAVATAASEPQAIIMSLGDYVDAVAPEPDWLKKIRGIAKRRGTDRLTMREIDGLIADTRRQVRANRSR